MENPNQYMRSLIDEFPDQVENALSIAENFQISGSNGAEIKNIVISGLGGSGIGGTISSQLIENELNVPVIINNDYSLPNFTDENSLLIISSYSGNTEETVSAVQEGIGKKARIVCITSNGKIQEIAEEKGIEHVIIPGGYPPRAALAYSLIQQFAIMNKLNLISNSYKKEFKSSADLLKKNKEDLLQKAQTIAKGLKGKVPVIYTEVGYEGVGVRLRQQLNENAKILCWHHCYPEMNHNELV
ncbi:MAG: SIS domain-containing protein, partial [Flavobacteriales bacterium]